MGAGNRGAGPGGPPEAFYAEVITQDLLSDIGFVPTGGTVDVDWGDGSFVTGLSGSITGAPLAPGPVVIKSDNTITRITFDYNAGNGYGNTNLKNIDIVNSSTLTDASFICQNITPLETFSMADGSNITTFEEAFRGCTDLTSFTVVNNDMSSAEEVSSAWKDCSSLTSFPLIEFSSTASPNSWDGGTYFTNAWEGCSSLTLFPAIDFKFGWQFTNLFSGCTGLTSISAINIGDADFWLPAQAIESGVNYEIRTVDGTDYTAVGAPDNNIGTTFLSTGFGGGLGGTGHVYYADASANIGTGIFASCTSLVCIASVNTSNIASDKSVFSNTPLLTSPSAGEQTSIETFPGLDYVNGSPCP